MDGFLLFNEDGSVEVRSYGLGYYSNNNSREDGKIFYKEYEENNIDSLLQSYNGHFTNIIRISSNLDLERSRNKEKPTQVVPTY